MKSEQSDSKLASVAIVLIRDLVSELRLLISFESEHQPSTKQGFKSTGLSLSCSFCGWSDAPACTTSIGSVAGLRSGDKAWEAIIASPLIPDYKSKHDNQIMRKLLPAT
mmetsp:Transcript_134519/g.261952  ORF Transcript_134519/g.261952 Transcript_134519/m.261952 type:complete len:109 (+) Transcript_134519:1413-1739(+)